MAVIDDRLPAKTLVLTPVNSVRVRTAKNKFSPLNSSLARVLKMWRSRVNGPSVLECVDGERAGTVGQRGGRAQNVPSRNGDALEGFNAESQGSVASPARDHPWGEKNVLGRILDGQKWCTAKKNL